MDILEINVLNYHLEKKYIDCIRHLYTDVLHIQEQAQYYQDYTACGRTGTDNSYM